MMNHINLQSITVNGHQSLCGVRTGVKQMPVKVMIANNMVPVSDPSTSQFKPRTTSVHLSANSNNFNKTQTPFYEFNGEW